jgi:predicted DNA-binding transcriptional regulator YafY
MFGGRVNRTERLYAVAEELRRAGAQGTTSARLARSLEVSIRTIKRDVSALQQAGLPVRAEAGPGGG